MFHISLRQFKGRTPAVKGTVPDGPTYFAAADTTANSQSTGSVPNGASWYASNNISVVSSVTYANSTVVTSDVTGYTTWVVNNASVDTDVSGDAYTPYIYNSSPIAISPAINSVPNSFSTTTLAVVGINNGSVLTIVGGMYSVNNAPFSTVPGTINNGDTLVIKTLVNSQSTSEVKLAITYGGASKFISWSVADAVLLSDILLEVIGYEPTDISSFNSTANAWGSLSSGAAKFSTASLHFDIGYLRDFSNTAYSIADAADLTVEFYIKRTGIWKANPGIFSTNGAYGIDIYGSGTNVNFGYNTPTGYEYIGDIALSENVWTHIALVKTGNTTKVYFNGTLGHTGSAVVSLTSTKAALGYRYAAVANPALSNCLISNFRFLNKAAWTSNFSVPTLDYSLKNVQFYFVDQSNVGPSTEVSTSTAVIGINNGVAISVSGGTYSINGGVFTSSVGTINNGDIVELKTTSSSSSNGTVTPSLTIDGVTKSWSVTTVTAYADAGTQLQVVGFGGVDSSQYSLNPTQTGSVTSGPALDTMASMNFATGQYCYNNTGFAVGTGDFQVDAWIRRTGSMSTAGILGGGRLAQDVGGALSGIQIITTGATTISIGIGNAGTNTVAANATLAVNTWTHIRLSRESGVLNAYVNGSHVGSVSSSMNLLSQFLAIGGRYGNTTGTYKLSNCAISNVQFKNYSDGYGTTSFSPIATDLAPF